jgi:hypothetical protein
VLSFSAVTTAPVTTAPELSNTVPLMSEVEVCPEHTNAQNNNRAETERNRNRSNEVGNIGYPFSFFETERQGLQITRQ